MRGVLCQIQAILFFLFVPYFSAAQNTPADSIPAKVPYRKADLWGFAAAHTKKILIQPQYHEVAFFENGLAQVRLEKSWGLINESGKELLKPTYTKIGKFDKNGLAVVQLGEIVEDTKPNEVKYGVINRKGEIVIPVKFSSLIPANTVFIAGVGYKEPVYFRRNRSWHMEPKEYVLLNLKGKEISKKYDRINSFSGGMAEVNKGYTWGVNRYGFSEDQEPGLWGYIDSLGREVVPVSLHFASPFKEGLALVYRQGSTGGTNFINKSGKDISDKKYAAGRPFQGGVAQVNRNNRWGLIDRNEKVIADFFYVEMGYFDSNGLAKVEMVEQQLSPNGYPIQKRGYINRKGEVVVPLREWFIEPFKANGFAKVFSGEKEGRVNLVGKVVLEMIYKSIVDMESGFMVVDQNEKRAFLNREGKLQVPPGKYDFVGEMKSGRAYVSKGGKYGYINKDGKEVIALQFQASEHDPYGMNMSFSEGMAPLCQGSRCGYIDSTGKVIIPLKFQLVDSFKGGWAQVSYQETSEGRKKSLVNKKGMEVPLEGNLRSVGATANLLRITPDDRKFGFMNAEGKMVIPVAFNLDYYDPTSFNFKSGLIKVVYSYEEDAAAGNKTYVPRTHNRSRIKGYMDVNGVVYYED